MKQLVLVLVVACSSTQPDRAPRPEPVVAAPADSAAAAPDAVAIALPDAFVAPPDASVAVDAAATSVATTNTADQEGRGSCKVDRDCVLSSYQSGCCTQACQPNAISAKQLAAAQAKEDCEAFRQSGKPCPPPAPCPVYTTHPVGVKCKAGTCYAVMAPGPSRP
ncbi:MAG: hypothetical protein H0T89_33355 [Deltaproteobacteria bacterium]|nr:hypothetical protein [Deltaproteobacteria bacterium]MDQ3297986.1 hypothetical protein [Myxococcota bacterium]